MFIATKPPSLLPKMLYGWFIIIAVLIGLVLSNEIVSSLIRAIWGKSAQTEAKWSAIGVKNIPCFSRQYQQLRFKWYPISFWLLRFCKGLVSILLFCLKKWDLHRNGARLLVGSVLGARMRFQPQKLVVFLRFVVNPSSNRYKKCKIYRDTFFNYIHQQLIRKNPPQKGSRWSIWRRSTHSVSLHEIESEERFVRAISFFAVSTGLAACQAQGSLRELVNRLYI